jgi:proton-dependent oligopeptide transporter, POT family
MNDDKTNKASFRDFPLNFWIVIMFEFFERGSYYGMMSFLSVYMTDELGFAKSDVGIIKGVIVPLLYFLPLITGAIADKLGYRRSFLAAFSLLGIGYFLTSQVTDYTYLFAALLIMAVGAGTFKPIVSGTIAKLTDDRTATLGFGIFYWAINFGAFLFPLILVPALKKIDSSYVMIASAIFTGAMILPTLLIFKEPPGFVARKEPFGTIIADIFNKIWLVFKDWRFITFILIYSIFWILYFQMFDTVLWYVSMFIDAEPLNKLISPALESLFGIKWFFDVEHVTVINALTIIALQLVVSSIVKRTKAMPTMISGVVLGIIGMGILAISQNIWVFLVGIIVFSIGEMTAHPKFFSYLGVLAPADKKATYMGFSFLYGVPSAFLGPVVGALLYNLLVDNPMIAYIKSSLATMGKSSLLSSDVTIQSAMDAAKTAGIDKAQILSQAQTQELWLIFCGIGVVCVIGLLLYDKFIGTAIKKQSGVQNENI